MAQCKIVLKSQSAFLSEGENPIFQPGKIVFQGAKPSKGGGFWVKTGGFWAKSAPFWWCELPCFVMKNDGDVLPDDDSVQAEVQVSVQEKTCVAAV